jgi:hypothetical protein
LEQEKTGLWPDAAGWFLGQDINYIAHFWRKRSMSNNQIGAERQARQDYEQALSRAFWRKVRAWLGRGCNDLLSYRETLAFLETLPKRDLGRQQVPLDRIVGSTGRATDFDLGFYPRRREAEDRWVGVAQVRYRGKAWPPVLLYQVGRAYFVEDGNHRLSVARANGDEFITAQVIEIDTSTLTPAPTCSRLGFKVSPDGSGC